MGLEDALNIFKSPIAIRSKSPEQVVKPIQGTCFRDGTRHTTIFYYDSEKSCILRIVKLFEY
jgi:hypothetical protein